MKIIPRTLAHTITRAAKTFPAVVITGPRQSGKTTLLRHMFGDTHRFYSLEDLDVRDRVQRDPRAFLAECGRPVVIDEVQYAPRLLSYLKTEIDNDRKPGNWILTGSQNFALMAGVSQSLAGRAAVLTLLPFSFREANFLGDLDISMEGILASLGGGKPETTHFQEKHPNIWDFLLRGSYPEPCANPEVDRQLWCSGYVQLYLERDVRQILNVSDLSVFERFLQLTAARTAQILNFSELARDVGVTMPTIKKWIGVLEASYLVFLLPPYFKNYGKRLVKNPKLYFLDTGLATYLLKIHARDALVHGPLAGALFETLVVGEWVKEFFHRGERLPLYFWRSHDDLEVDLLIERNGKLFPIEIKASSTITQDQANGLEKWMKRSGCSAGTIVAPVEQSFQLTDRVRVLNLV